MKKKDVKKPVFGKCQECDEEKELKKDVYGEFYCEECLEAKKDNGDYMKMD